MNTKDLIRNRQLLAIIVGVAVIATIGVSAAYAASSSDQIQVQNSQNQKPQIQGSINLQQNLLSNIQTKFSVAADMAASAVSNGKVIGGSLTVMQGYVVYSFKVIDDKNMVYSVIVDPRNGQVLFTSQGHPMNIGSLFTMNHSFMKHKFRMNGYSGNMPQPPTSNTPQPPTSDNTILPSGLQE